MVTRIAVCIVLIAVSGFYARELSASRVQSAGMPPLEAVQKNVGTWTSREIPMSQETLDVLKADHWMFRDYRNAEGSRVVVFVAYFANQEVGSQIHSPRNCLPGSGWTVQSIDPVSLAVSDPPQDCNLMQIERKGDRQEVFYWFKTRSGTVTGEYALKWDLVKNSLKRRPTDAAFIRFMSTEKDSQAMKSLMSVLNPQIHGALGEVGLP